MGKKGEQEEISLNEPDLGKRSKVQGHLTALKDFKAKYPKKVILEKVYHSSPTWTINGIKSLLTGALPTESLKDKLFNEDGNYEGLLDALKGNRKAYFFGDIYWKQFIDKSKQFWKSVEYFNWFGSNINQDGKVIDKVLNVIEQHSDFDVIFSHMSDLDSSVHLHNLESKESVDAIMKDQVLFTKFLAKIIEFEKKLEETGQDITLIVTSDHGLIKNGHGGGSELEK